MNELSLILNQLPDAVVCTDVVGVITHWNRAAESLFGFSADEAVGQGLDLIIPVRLREAHWQGFRRAVESGQTSPQGGARLTKAVRKSGDVIYIEASFGLLKDASGQVVGVTSVCRDVTQRQLRAQQASPAARS